MKMIKECKNHVRINRICIVIEYFYVFYCILLIQNFYDVNLKYDLLTFIKGTAFWGVYYFFFRLMSDSNRTISESIYNAAFSFILVSIISHTYFSYRSTLTLVFDEFSKILIIQLTIFLLGKMLLILLKRKFTPCEKLILIGSVRETRRIAKKIFLSRKEYVKIVGIYNYISSSILDKIDCADMLLIGNSVHGSIRQELINISVKNNKKVYIIPEIYDINVSQYKFVQFDDFPVFEIEDFLLTPIQKKRKRIFDILVATTSLLILSPIILTVSIVIKLYDGGPVFFKQMRLTEKGKQFMVFKFRSMIVDAEKETGAVLAIKDDKRITPFGKVMRKTRLDEIPQFINVLKGEMSIIGPRPERPEFYKEYDQIIPEFKQRLLVKAGITGLAQVLSRYTTVFEDKLIYDLEYIREYSFLLDLRIILQTIRVIFSKDSASGKDNDAPSIFNSERFIERAERLNTKGEVTIKRTSNMENIEDKIESHNISLTGMSFKSKARFEIGECIEVITDIGIVSNSKELLRVVRVEQQKYKVLYGCEFVKINDLKSEKVVLA